MVHKIMSRVSHPGVFLAKEIEARGWSKTQFAKIIGKTPTEVGYITNGHRSINPEFALRTELATGIDAYTWLDWQNHYDLYMLNQSKSEIKLLNGIPERAQEFSKTRKGK